MPILRYLYYKGVIILIIRKDGRIYFRTGTCVNIKKIWNNILDIDLPKTQAISDAVGNTDFITTNSSPTCWCFGSKVRDLNNTPWCHNSLNAPYFWLFNYSKDASAFDGDPSIHLEEAEAAGSWMNDLITGTSYSLVSIFGRLDYDSISNSSGYGIRPVISLLKSNLSR